MPRLIYTLALRLALPAVLLAFLWRGWRNAAYRGSVRERLGLSRPRADRPLWLHAASVGEVQALAPLLQPLHAEGVPLLVTVGTPTGLARARALLDDLRRSMPGPALDAQAAVWDLPGAARRFLHAVRPRAGVFVETELWPNLIAAAAHGKVPLALVSARLSERSLRRYLRLAPRLMRDTVSKFGAIGAQSEADRARFVALGAAAETASVTGNLKFDVPHDPALSAHGEALRARWSAGRPLWVAGSTHAEEEQICVDAHHRLVEAARAAGLPSPVLVIAPRRPERFADVGRWLEAQRLVCAHSADAPPPSAIDVVLVNEMGVLRAWYAAADVAFVGGTLVPVGGHNLLEPAALGRPVLAGPHSFNVPDVARVLHEAGGLRRISDEASLATELGMLLEDAGLRQRMGGLAAAAVAANRGAAGRARALIAALPAVVV